MKSTTARGGATKAKTTTARKATSGSATPTTKPKESDTANLKKTTKTAAKTTKPTTNTTNARAGTQKNTVPTNANTPEKVAAPSTSVAAMTKRELLLEAAAKSGVKRKDAKPVIEAVLEILGSALRNERELNLHPMGKIKTTRVIKRSAGQVQVCRVRLKEDKPAD